MFSDTTGQSGQGVGGGEGQRERKRETEKETEGLFSVTSQVSQMG